MPFSLLLTRTFTTLTAGARKLAPWEQLAGLELRILERARSVFLVRWFGAVPVDGLAVKAWISNIHALQTRYLEVRDESRRAAQRASGPNLIEPLGGMAGALVGALSSPLNALSLSLIVGRLSSHWGAQLYAGLNWVTLGLVQNLIGFFLLLGGAAAFAFLPPGAGELLAAIAALAVPLERIWRQITGPRAEVRNPVLRALLDLGDSVAGFVFQLLGAFAFIVVRIGPLLDPLRARLTAWLAICGVLVESITTIWTSASTLLKTAIMGPGGVWDALQAIPVAMRRTLARLGIELTALGARATVLLEGMQQRVGGTLTSLWNRAQPEIESYTTRHPTVTWVRALAAELTVAGAALDAWNRAHPEPPPAPPGWVERQLRSLLPTAPGPAPTLWLPPTPAAPIPMSAITPVARTLLVLRNWFPDHVGDPFRLDEQAERGLRRAHTPTSVFAARARALRATPDADTVRAVQDADRWLDIATRLVPAEVAAHVPRIEHVLRELDDALHGRPIDALPVRHVPESERLRTEIGRVRLHASGAQRADTDRFMELVRAALVSTPVPVPAGG